MIKALLNKYLLNLSPVKCVPVLDSLSPIFVSIKVGKEGRKLFVAPVKPTQQCDYELLCWVTKSAKNN